MKVEFISVTESASDSTISPEQLIVQLARVSNPSNENNHESASRLLNYLIKNKHWSPFEMVDMTVEIVTSRAIAQQILRHRSFSFQEFSQRYAQVAEIEPISIRRQAEKNRQSSTDEFDPILNDGWSASKSIMLYINGAKMLYRQLIDAGVAKECARMVLPLSTQTRLYMKGSVRSWIHYLAIRCDEHTQLEHRQIADKIKGIFKDIFPSTAKALEL